MQHQPPTRCRKISSVLVPIVVMVATVSVGSSSGAGVALDPHLEPDPVEEPTTIVVGASRITAFLPVFIAQEMGEFERENLTVQFTDAQGTDLVVLLTQGRIDLAAAGFGPGILNLAADGDAVKLVYPASSTYEPDAEFGVWARTEIVGEDGFSPSDLRGHSIGSSFGPSSPTIGYFFQELMRQDAEFSVNDVTFEQLGSATDVPLALVNGAVDAAYVVPPLDTVVIDSGCCVFVGGNPPIPFGYWAVGSNVLSGDVEPEVVTAFLRAIERTSRTHLSGNYLEDPEIGPVVEQILSTPLEGLQAVPLGRWQFEGDLQLEILMDLQDYYFYLGDLLSFEEPLPADVWFDQQYIDEIFAG